MTHDDGYPFGRDKPNHARAECRRRTPSELRRDAARYRGAAHPLCFIDEVMEHEFPEGFKPINIESYDGMMTHKYRGYIIVLSISKSVEPNEEQKEMISGF